MDNVINYLKDILNDNDVVVLANSGGPDSMCLFSLLMKIPNIRVICAHVNHKVRKESDKEMIFVKEECQKNKIIFEYMEILKYKNDKFSEVDARNQRYQFFKRIVKKYKAKYLFTAHHGDDLIETILMRIVRGSSLYGCVGIKKEDKRDDYTILRPLIELTKEDIMKYNKENNIKYVTDLSNKDDTYTRNRYRKYILPKLKEEDKNVHKKFLKFSRNILNYDYFVKKAIAPELKKIISNNILVVEEYNKSDQFVKNQCLYYLLSNRYQEDYYLINDNHLTIVNNIIRSNQTNCEADLPGNFIVKKSYGKITIELKKETQPYQFTFDKELLLPNKKTLKIIKNSDENSNSIIRLNSEDIKLPLIVRTKKDGDKIAIKNMSGSQKIKDLFINSKIELDKRELWPLLVDSNNNILWIPGLKKSKFDKDKKEKYDIIIKYI